MKIYHLLFFGILYICITLKQTLGKSTNLSKSEASIKPQKSTNPILGNSDTFFKSKSYQSMVVMNGTGSPVSEKKMSVFSVEDHNEGNG